MLASSLSLHEGVHVNQGVKTYNMMKIAVVSDHFFVMDRLKEYNIYCRMLTNHVLNPIGWKQSALEPAISNKQRHLSL